MATQTANTAAVLRSRDFLGRDVLDGSNNKLGTIHDLLLDRRSGKVQFVEVDLGVFRKRVIVPVNRVDWGEAAFLLRGWMTEQVKRLPEYEADRPLTGEMLDELVWAYPTFYGEEEYVPGPRAAGEPNFVPMRDTKDFKVKSDEPDLRGWNVFGTDGERIGKVTDLLVDPAAMKVAFLDVDLYDDLFMLKDDRHVLIPTEAVEVRERGQDVWVRDLTARDVARLPAYTGGAADPAVVTRVTDFFDGSEHRRDYPDDRRMS